MASRFASLVAAFALLVSQAPAAKAFIVPPSPGTVQALGCEEFDAKIFNSDSRDAPAIIASSFSGEGARLVFRTCRDYEGNTHYYVRAPRPNRNGVCRALQQEIFPATDSDQARISVTYSSMEGEGYIALKGWTNSIPQDWAALRYTSRTQEYGFLTGSACPLGDDARYMWLTNVTDDVLKSFQSAWERIAASQQSLETAIANLPAEAVPFERFDTPERKEKLRERVIQDVLAGREIPQGYRCDTETDCFATFNSFTIEFVPVPGGIVPTKLLANWRA